MVSYLIAIVSRGYLLVGAPLLPPDPAGPERRPQLGLFRHVAVPVLLHLDLPALPRQSGSLLKLGIMI